MVLFWDAVRYSVTPSYMCRGMIVPPVASKISMNEGKGCFSRKTTVCESGAVIVSTFSITWRVRAKVAGRNFWKLNSTSSAVKGLPSCHFTFLRSLKV